AGAVAENYCTDNSYAYNNYAYNNYAYNNHAYNPITYLEDAELLLNDQIIKGIGIKHSGMSVAQQVIK
ncbi:hypothetical protein H5202_04345, partial [Shewanella sp. SG41-4]|uniref:hypothetical protein n=1 Tax=Shewanella sp. SG41-4 TaxID=2760976 RepID=UPI00184AACD7